MARTGFAFRLDLMLARAFSILAAGLLLGALAPATALADLSAGTIETYDELVSACQRGGTYTLVEDITYGGAYPRVSAWLTIDLNNHTIDANGEQSVFYVVSRASLTITGNGTIKGASDCGVEVRYGSFTMEGGTISGTGFDGIKSVGGEIFIKGGSISGNGFTGIWSNSGSVHVTGGTISGNRFYAIQCYMDGQLLLSGSPSISGTVNLRDCPPMVIEGALSYNNPVSVLFETSDTPSAGTFTSGFAAKCGSDADPATYFTSAASGFAVVKSSDGTEAAMAPAHGITCTVRDTFGNETGGSVTASPNPAVAGQEVTLTITPAQYYDFTEVKVMEGDGENYPLQTGSDPLTYAFTMPDEDVTVTATFLGDPMKVEFMIVGEGTWSDGTTDPIEQFVPYGSKPQMVPTGMIPATGYRFAFESHWHYDGNECNPLDFTITDPNVTTFITNFVGIEYVLRFEPGAEGVEGTMDPQLFIYDDPPKAIRSCAFTREGYTFDGWSGSDGNTYTDGQEIQNLSTVKDDLITLTATWERSPARITFDLAGGTMEGQTGTYVLEAKVGDVITLKAPTRTNYQFQYWQGSEYYEGDEYTVTGDHTLKAVWKQVIPTTGDGGGSALLICAFAAVSALVALLFAGRRMRRC